MATTTMMNNSESSMMSLLERTKALIEAERSLTATIEKVEPWLASTAYQKNSSTSSSHRSTVVVRPIPRTMEEARQVLAVGRNFASRTSAPAGWNPAAPLVGFSTPNPLPHQLRGGAMAALQLDRAKEAESDKKRKRQLEEEEKQEAAAKKQAEEAAQSKQSQQADKERNEKKQQQQKQHQQQQQHVRRVAAMNQAQPTADSNMNLSDSSSEEESESEEED